MGSNLNPALPLRDAAIATLERLGWLLSPCIYGGTTAIHSGQQRRLDALTVTGLIELAADEATKQKTPAAARQ